MKLYPTTIGLVSIHKITMFQKNPNVNNNITNIFVLFQVKLGDKMIEQKYAKLKYLLSKDEENSLTLIALVIFNKMAGEK